MRFPSHLVFSGAPPVSPVVFWVKKALISDEFFAQNTKRSGNYGVEVGATVPPIGTRAVIGTVTAVSVVARVVATAGTTATPSLLVTDTV
jgi:hypothetical protein